ncbi:MAG TPA: hypothetical protein PLS82_15950 [Phycisphaerae bacterium]|nr:hypothetical protein [Phycisphaerae bacterium]
MSEQVVVRCPQCAQKYRVPRTSVGHQGRCKLCQARFRIASESNIDEDTVFAWITEDDPFSESVAGSTGIFSKPVGPPRAAGVAPRLEPAPATGAGVSSCEVKLVRIDTQGAHFEFPTAALAGEHLRNSFPRKCVGCGTRIDLRVHLIYWRDRMPVNDALTWQARQDAAMGKLVGYDRPFEPGLLRQLPNARGLAEPFSLPFPIFACPHCRPSHEVQGRVATHKSHETCRLTIASLAVAVDFFRDNGGRNSPDYHRLIEERDQHPDAWRAMDARVRQRVSQWFVPGEDERFVGFFRDAEFPPGEAGASGLVLTSRRLVFHKYVACRDYSLEAPGRVEIVPRGRLAGVHIYDQSGRPAIVKLDPAAAVDLAGQLRQLRCKWNVMSR